MQVDRNRPVTCQRQPKAHPAVSSAKIQDQCSCGKSRRQNTLHEIAISARPDSPLLAVAAGDVTKWKGKIKVTATTATAFRNANPLVVFHELGVMLASHRRKSVDDSVIRTQSKTALEAIGRAEIRAAPRTAKAKFRFSGMIRSGTDGRGQRHRHGSFTCAELVAPCGYQLIDWHNGGSCEDRD